MDGVLGIADDAHWQSMSLLKYLLGNLWDLHHALYMQRRFPQASISPGARFRGELDEIRIGGGTIIGAGSVISTDIPPYAVATGVPARVIKTRIQ